MSEIWLILSKNNCMDRIFVSGIHTGIGKTIVSAVLCEALHADYFKPVQTGFPPDRDSEVVKNLISNKNTHIFPETFLFSAPVSPHTAAQMENKTINMYDIVIPETNNLLIIEGAGGLMSPIDSKHTMLEFAIFHHLPVILTVQFYLGAINHTILCIEQLFNSKVKFLGIIINGEMDSSALDFIRNKYPRLNVLGHIPFCKEINQLRIKEFAIHFQNLHYV